MSDRDIILEDIKTSETAIKNAVQAIQSALENFEKRQEPRNFETDYVDEKLNEIKIRQGKLRRLDYRLNNL